MELVVSMALFAIISTFAVTMVMSINTKANGGLTTVGATNELKRAENLIENWFYSGGSGNDMRCVNVVGGTPDSPVTTAPATTTTTTTTSPTTAATTPASTTTEIQSGMLLDWNNVTLSGTSLMISNSPKGYSAATDFSTSRDGWMSYKSQKTDKDNCYFWGFPTGYTLHTGFRFKAYASESGVTLTYGYQSSGNKQKTATLSDTAPDDYFYIETSYLGDAGGNITFYPNKTNVTVYISDIEYYDIVTVETTTTTTTKATTTTTTTVPTTATPPLSPIGVDIQNGVIVIMNSGNSNETYLVFDKDNMTISCGNQYESETLELKKSQGLEISTNGTLLKLVFDVPDFSFNKRVMMFAKRTTD